MIIHQLMMLTPPTCTGIPDPAHPGGFIIDPSCSGNGPSLTSQLLTDAIFGPAVKSASDWLSQLLVSATTTFTNTPLPDLGNTDATSLSPAVGFLRSSTYYVGSALLVLSVIFGMIKMAASRDAREGLKPGVAIVRYLATVTISAAVVVMLLVMGNAYAVWIIDLATNGGGLGDNLFKLFQGAGILSALGYVVMLVITALFAGLLLASMILRAAALPVLIGAGLPLAAAASGTPAGKKAFDQLLAWVGAFCILEPAVATILATGFTLMSQNTKDGWGPFMQGMVLIMLASLSLPSLLRILVPNAGQMAGGRGLGSAALGAAATVVGLAAFGAGAGKAHSAAGTGSPPPAAGAGGGPSPASTPGSTGSGGASPPPPAPPPGGGSPPGSPPPAPPPPASGGGSPPGGKTAPPPVSTWTPGQPLTAGLRS